MFPQKWPGEGSECKWFIWEWQVGMYRRKEGTERQPIKGPSLWKSLLWINEIQSRWEFQTQGYFKPTGRKAEVFVHQSILAWRLLPEVLILQLLQLPCTTKVLQLLSKEWSGADFQLRGGGLCKIKMNNVNFPAPDMAISHISLSLKNWKSDFPTW